MIKFLTDANVFVPIVERLREMDHDVFDIKEEGLEKLTDIEVFQTAQNQKRILITMDKDFSNILLYPPSKHHGIIVLKLYKMKVDDATRKFIDAFKTLKLTDITGNLVIIDRRKTRVRKESIIE